MTQWRAEAAGWLQSVDWGSAPDWFAAVGTVGAFAATIAIIQSERMRRTRAQADAFVTYTSLKWGPRYPIKDLSVRKMKKIEKEEGSLYHWILTLYVHNTSGQPIVRSALRSDPRSGIDFHTHQVLESSEDKGLAIAPGESLSREVRFESNPMGKKFYLFFTDSDGKSWVREVTSGSYISRRELRSIRKVWIEQEREWADTARRLRDERSNQSE